MQQHLLRHGGACHPLSALSALLPPSAFVPHTQSSADGRLTGTGGLGNQQDGDAGGGGGGGVYPCAESLLKELQLK